MRKSKWWLAAAVGALAVVLGASIALAAELSDGDYTLTLPGVGEFEFTVDSEGEDEQVTATAAPDGYEVDDDDPAKAAWKNDASLEVEVKTDKVEADVVWTEENGTATLSLPGGSITVIFDTENGNFEVQASGDWTAFGSGTDWYVANAEVIEEATEFFKVEADEDSIEIIAVDSADDGFLNDLDDEDEEEVEAEEEEEEEEEVEEEDDRGPPENPGRP